MNSTIIHIHVQPENRIYIFVEINSLNDSYCWQSQNYIENLSVILYIITREKNVEKGLLTFFKI